MSRDMLVRIVVGLALILLLLATLYFGGWVQCVLYSLVAFALVYEAKSALERKGYRPFAVPAYVFALGAYAARELLSTYAMLMLACLCVFANIFFGMASRSRRNEDMFASLSLYFYPLCSYVFLMLTSTMIDFSRSRVSMMMVFAAPCCADMAAYFVGVFLGRHKLCPHISPKKTVEGAVGGLLGGVLGGLLVYFAQGMFGVALPLWVLLCTGFICGAVGQMGDLFASCVKRWANIKDFGTILPGHGGMLDRMDSILMCAPAVCAFFYMLAEYGVI